MSADARLAAITAPLRTRWAALTAQQQRLILWAGALLALALFVAFVWLPLNRAKVSIAQRLPALHAQHAALQRDAEDVKRLKSLPPAAASAQGRVLDINQLRAVFTGADVAALGSGRYRVMVPDGRFGRWLDGVRALNGQLVVAELAVRREGSALRIEAVLQPPKAGS
jgi:type II secretory pathway component PulM